MPKDLLRWFFKSLILFLLLLFLPNQHLTAGSFRDVLLGNASGKRQQDSVVTFNTKALRAFDAAGDALSWSRNYQYASNIMTYLVPLIGYTKEEKLERSGFSTNLVEETKLSSLGYILNIGSFVTSIASVHKVGSAGSRFHAIGRELPPDLEYKFAESGNHLHSFRTLSYVSTGIGLAASIMLADAVAAVDEESDEEVAKKLLTTLGVSIAGLIVKVIAVNKVDNAGEHLVKFSDHFDTEWKKFYLSEAGKNLRRYNENWDSGLGLIFGGLALAIGSGLLGEQQVAEIGAVTGGIMAIVGHVYMAWVAPYNLGVAGGKLQDLQERLNRLE
jgi:hypothetical protein